MILKKDIHHPNDVMNKYFENVMPEKLKDYFKLPGKFISNFPTKIFRRDGSEREMDWLMLVEDCRGEFLIHVEFQSYAVDDEKIEIIADCTDYSKIYYGRPVLTVIIMTEGYGGSVKEFKRTSSDILKPIYICMSEEEVIERLNNLEEKILNHKKLTDDEALDIAFLPMFAPKNKAHDITEKVTRLFREDTSLTGAFRNDIAFGLSIMIRKYFDLTPRGKELLKMIEPELDASKLRDVIDFEVDYIKKSYEKELSEKDDILAEKDSILAEKDMILAEKDKEIEELKAKLKVVEDD